MSQHHMCIFFQELVAHIPATLPYQVVQVFSWYNTKTGSRLVSSIFATNTYSSHCKSYSGRTRAHWYKHTENDIVATNLCNLNTRTSDSHVAGQSIETQLSWTKPSSVLLIPGWYPTSLHIVRYYSLLKRSRLHKVLSMLSRTRKLSTTSRTEDEPRPKIR